MTIQTQQDNFWCVQCNAVSQNSKKYVCTCLLLLVALFRKYFNYHTLSKKSLSTFILNVPRVYHHTGAGFSISISIQVCIIYNENGRNKVCISSKYSYLQGRSNVGASNTLQSICPSLMQSLTHLFIHSTVPTYSTINSKGTAIPAQARRGPECSSRCRLMTIGTRRWQGYQSYRTGRIYPLTPHTK